MIDQINSLADGWIGALWKASFQGGMVVLLVWCICRFVPRISPAVKVWLWRLAWAKFLLALFWAGSIELPLLPPPAGPTELMLTEPTQSAWLEAPGASHIVIAPSLKPIAILFLLWITGILMCLVRLAFQWRHCGQLRHRALPISNESLAELCSRFGIRRIPALRESSAIASPMLVGIFRPAIIVPSSQIDPQRLALMLAHELAHLKRRDLLWGWLPAICQTLFFFHPLLWLTRREWLLEQEMACDQLALRHSAASPATYGNMLVDLITSNVPCRFGALGICETTKNLKRRILAMKMIGTANSRLLMAALLITALTGILPWRIVAQDKPEDDTKRLQQLEKENAALRAELDKLKRAADRGKLDSEELRSLESARVAAQLAVEINAAEGELAALRNKYRDAHPTVREAEARLKKLKDLQAVERAQRATTKEKAARERDLYLEELALAQNHVDSIQKAMENGRASREELFRAQREMFGIRRELANLDKNRGQIKALMQEEIEIVQRQSAEAKKIAEAGLAPVGHDLALRRELLKLKRELLLQE